MDLSGTWSSCQKTAMIFPFARIFFMYNHFNLLLFETFFSFSALGLRYLAFYFKGDFLECYICEDHFYSDHRYLRAIFHSPKVHVFANLFFIFIIILYNSIIT